MFIFKSLNNFFLKDEIVRKDDVVKTAGDFEHKATARPLGGYLKERYALKKRPLLEGNFYQKFLNSFKKRPLLEVFFKKK